MCGHSCFGGHNTDGRREQKLFSTPKTIKRPMVGPGWSFDAFEWFWYLLDRVQCPVAWGFVTRALKKNRPRFSVCVISERRGRPRGLPKQSHIPHVHPTQRRHSKPTKTVGPSHGHRRELLLEGASAAAELKDGALVSEFGPYPSTYSLQDLYNFFLAVCVPETKREGLHLQCVILHTGRCVQ